MNMWVLRPTICLVFMPLYYCEAGAQEPVGDEDSLARIVALIDMIPSWPLLGWKTSGEEKKLVFRKARLIEECAFRISQFSSDDIRQSITRYEESIEHGQRIDDRREALFFLNKYLFDIPELVGRDSPNFPIVNTGWLGMPIADDPNGKKPSDKARQLAGRGRRMNTGSGTSQSNVESSHTPAPPTIPCGTSIAFWRPLEDGSIRNRGLSPWGQNSQTRRKSR